jgi:hypothetical protein
MKPLAAVAIALVAAPPALVRSPPFQGHFVLRLQDVEPQGATYTLRDTRMRIDVPSVAHARDVHAIVDLQRGALLTSTAGRPWTPLVALPDRAAPSNVTVHERGTMRAVVGQPCEEWSIDDGGSRVEACVVRDVPWLDPRRLVGGQVPGWSRFLEARRAFPVSVWQSGHRGPPFAMWATDVDHAPVADDAFAVPRTARAH